MSGIKITEQEGQSLIQNYTKSKNVKFIKYELIPISEVAEGYFGEHFILRVTYLEDGKSSTVDFFIKHTPTKTQSQIELAKETNVYEREIFLYDYLFKEFKKFGFDTSFAAESYYCIPDTAIIMENMKHKNYTTMERHIKFSVQHLKCVLRALALYHGAGFAYQKTKSLQLDRNYKLTDDYMKCLEENFFIQHLVDPNNTGARIFWDGAIKTVHTLIDLLPEHVNKKKFHNLLETFQIGKIFADDTKYAKTVGHGDLWSNNVLFKMNGDQPENCCLVDFQVLRYFYPSYDVILVIYSNTDKKFRDKYFRELCDYYYDTLTEIYQNYGFDLDQILPKDDFEETIVMLKADMLLQVLSTSAITCIPKEILNEKGKTDEGFHETFFDNHKISAKAFLTDDAFRNQLSELLIDLYDTLAARSD